MKFGFTKEEWERIIEILEREPNEIEVGIFKLNWSEHCSYKTSKIFLRELPTNSDRLILGIGENAGVLKLKDNYVISFKVESHNHPSAIEPFNGSATGVGGIVRDILSTGLRPIALLDSLRFGNYRSSKTRTLLDGVVRGISFYGNSIGVPVVAGEVYFEECYEDNPIVNVMCVGIGKIYDVRSSIAKGIGNSIIIFGNLTGRDGIGGAAFASEVLKDQEDLSAIQIADPFTEKLLIEAISEIVKFKELIAIQDLGAGGLSTAIPEMARKGNLGIKLYLDKVPVRSKDMKPIEILLSESQERMLICVEKGSEEKFFKVFEKWNLNYAVIAELIEEKKFLVYYNNNLLGDIPIDRMFDVPLRIYSIKTPHVKKENFEVLSKNYNYGEVLLKLISSENLCSRFSIYEQYDYMVGTDTILEPGYGDCTVLRIKDEDFGIAVKIDGNGRYIYLDPYEGSKIAVYECARNLSTVGAIPIGITDNINFPNPEIEENYYYFKPMVEGLRDSAKKLNIPFISGNVSLYNESSKSRIYPTITIGMVGLVENIENVRRLKIYENDSIYLVGKMEGNIGGSEFLKVLFNFVGGNLDKVDDDFEIKLQRSIIHLVKNGIASFVKDISEGGILIAISEALINQNKGASLFNLRESLEFLFGEWQSRYIIFTSKNEELEDFLKSQNITFLEIGKVKENTLEFLGYKIEIENLRKFYFRNLIPQKGDRD
ncbi:MAG: phosphoribosylformylglycinamidine synthase subunit PurL [candidate division WOR-3 bacterium]|nr:phosphoribosylformylglycinamidine synthase subunit PurL [candidate division WOR-3 bacterium]MCX7948274.1 phosphoribosylformylglycinamidine synthase subunit PurL [candidate division WOR-3 bacterium]MDW8150953.1 phosphoribosylformylglycinamidine synthase subunit PurL [candidate division WOR-3 bacterium]